MSKLVEYPEVLMTFVEKHADPEMDLLYHIVLLNTVVKCKDCNKGTSVVESTNFEYNEYVCPTCMLQEKYKTL